MLEYAALALLGLVVLAGLLYVTMSPEVEHRPATKAPTPKPHWEGRDQSIPAGRGSGGTDG